MRALGIDVGGSGVKGAIVDTKSGALVSERYRIATPDPATPKALAKVIARIVRHHRWKGPIGCAMPGPIKSGAVMIISNLDKSWVGVKAHELFTKSCGRTVTVLNDADAAGLAEMRFGAGKGERGVVLIVTLGTGIGSAMFVDGHLLPNSEFGQIMLRGKRAEVRASARARKEKNMSWAKWSRILNEYLVMLEQIIWPDVIIIGGGISRKANKFLGRLKVHAKVVPARLHNEAGIVGAALNAGPASARSARRPSSR